MQHPVGYVIDPATGRPMLNDFFALITNEKGWIFFWHTISAGLATASFVILGISAYHMARKNQSRCLQASFQMAAIVGLDRRRAGLPGRSHAGTIHLPDAAHEDGLHRGALGHGAAGLVLDPDHR